MSRGWIEWTHWGALALWGAGLIVLCGRAAIGRAGANDRWIHRLLAKPGAFVTFFTAIWMLHTVWLLQEGPPPARPGGVPLADWPPGWSLGWQVPRGAPHPLRQPVTWAWMGALLLMIPVDFFCERAQGERRRRFAPLVAAATVALVAGAVALHFQVWPPRAGGGVG